MRIRTILAGLTLLGACPLAAQSLGDPVQAGLTLGLAMPQSSSKMELSSGTLNGNGINQKTSFELGALAQVRHSSAWSSRWGFAYTFASPAFPVDLGSGTLATQSAKRNQLDLFGQAVYTFAPAWYALAGLDYVTRTLSAGGTDLDTFNKVGCSAGAGRSFRTGKVSVSPELLYTKAGQEGAYRLRAVVRF